MRLLPPLLHAGLSRRTVIAIFQQFIESGYDPRSELASSCALKIDPTNDAVAYDYNAAANFHLHKLPEEKKEAHCGLRKSTRAMPTPALARSGNSRRG